MYQVIVRGPDGSEASYSLGADQSLAIGREESCDIPLPSKRVSRRHARLFTRGGRLHLEDLGSQNGVFVGGARLSETTEIRPGHAIEIGEFKISLVQLEDGRVDQPGAAAPRLTGTGRFAGHSHTIVSRGFVGREAGVEYQVADDSVSRRHAELRRTADGGLSVTDQGSSNGTFVNGRRLVPNNAITLQPGDTVRFGETEWKLAGGASENSRKSARPLVAVLAVLVVAGAAAFILKGQQPVAVPADGDEATATATNAGGGAADEAAEADSPVEADADLDELLSNGQRAFENERFDEAFKLFGQALEQDPVNSDARQWRTKAKKELANKKLFDEAATKAGLGRSSEAIKIYFGIDPESIYFTRAGREVKELAPKAIKRDAAECRDLSKKRDWPKVIEVCRRYLDLKCLTGGDDAALKSLREAEKAERSPEAWACPQKLSAFLGLGTSTSDPSKEIAARYPDADLREAVLAYVRGDINDAIKRLSKAKGKAGAADLADQLRLIAGRYKEGDTAGRTGSLKDMQSAFEAALAADAKIVPANVVSFYAKEMKGRIVEAGSK